MSEDSTIKADADRTATLPDSSHDPRLIGHYRLLQKLGEGGMGEVWEAEQMEPVRRRVALKLIKRGMDSAHVLARFESERQAEVPADHPDVGRNLYNLACLYQEQGLLVEAETIHLQALEIRRASMGAQHPEVAGSLHDLANLYRDQQQWERAEALYLEAIEILRVVLDSDHPDLVTALSNYAELLHSQGREAEAAALRTES